MSDTDSITSPSPLCPAVARETPNPTARHVSDTINELDNIFVEEANHAQSRERFSGGPDRKFKRQICKAATRGNWTLASSHDITHPDWISTPLTTDGDTALHIAVRMGKINFVVKLVERLSKKDMETRRVDGNTAFCIAAISGYQEIARVLFVKHPGLVWIRGNEEKLPIQFASSAGHFSMVDWLFKRTLEDMKMKLPFHDLVTLFFLALTCNLYAVALSLLRKIPHLAYIENENKLNALQVLAQLPYDNKHDHDYKKFLSLLFEIMEDEEDQHLQHERISAAMFDAAKFGKEKILEFIFNYNPNMFMEINPQRQNILHIAILHRQASVYRLILKKGSYKNVLAQCVDIDGNNVLHLAGKLVGEGKYGSPIHQTHICSEELWFEGVEMIVPLAFRSMINKKEGLTPKELFYKEHRRASEKAIAELNGIANNFIVVGTLLLTLGITGALTIRTNNIKGDTLIFNEDIWYVIFIVSVALGLSLCATSMLLFTSVILPSTWREKGGGGFVNSRLTRVTFGYIIIFSSVVVMGVISTISGAMLVYNFLSVWVFCLIAVLCGVPTLLYFLFFYHSLYFSLRHIRVFVQKNAAKILSKMGINYTWDPFYLE